MSPLARTDLTTAHKINLGANALAQQGQYGAITTLATQFQVSRPTVYHTRQATHTALATCFAPPSQQINALNVEVDERQLQRAIIALRAIAPLSTWNIEDLLPILYPGLSRSHGFIVYTLKLAYDSAAAFNAHADMSTISAAALDELFVGKTPVLAGIDLDSGYIFALAARKSRSAHDWSEVIKGAKAQGLQLELVVKDAAPGIKAAVTQVYPGCEQRDDVFHARWRMGKVRSTLERRAYGAMNAELEVEAALKKYEWSSKRKRASFQSKLNHARRRTRIAIERHDRFEVAVLQVAEAMEVIDLVGVGFKTAQKMKEQILEGARRMKKMELKECRREGRYIENRASGLVLWGEQVGRELEELGSLYGSSAVDVAGVAWRLRHEAGEGRCSWDDGEKSEYLRECLCWLVGHMGEGALELLLEVDKVMERRHRASSAIEGFNAGLRPHLYVHRGVQQGFLELHRAHVNLRRRRWGQRRGTCAHEMVTGEDVGDWLSMLGFAPTVAAA